MAHGVSAGTDKALGSFFAIHHACEENEELQMQIIFIIKYLRGNICKSMNKNHVMQQFLTSLYILKDLNKE